MTYIVSHLKIMRKYADNRGTGHTIVGLARRHRHIFVVDNGDREGLHWFVCAMDCRVLLWALKVHIWEPISGSFLVRPTLKRLKPKGVAAHCSGFGFSRGWLVMWLSIATFS